MDDGSSAQQFSQGLIVDPDLLNTFSNAIGCAQKTLNFRLTQQLEVFHGNGSSHRLSVTIQKHRLFAAAFKEC